MAIIYIHPGGGCEAIIREEGNELIDETIHRHFCPNKDVTTVTFTGGGFTKRACQEHAGKWQAKLATK